MRALSKKTDFGAQVQHTSWLMYEYITLERLHGIGVTVPSPLSFGENAVLMEYIGSREGAAPTLSEVNFKAKEATTFFHTVLHQVETMLREDIIHGDLSAYNILFWEGDVTLIDFPQITNPRSNPNARSIFDRDVCRICEYFIRQGVRCDPEGLADTMWRRVVGSDA